MEEKLIFYDDKFCLESEPNALLTRAMLYGESVFTSILIIDGRPLFLNDHLNRLFKGATFLYGEKDVQGLKSRLDRDLKDFLSRVKASFYYLRITFFVKDTDPRLVHDKGKLTFFIWGKPLMEGVLKETSLGIAYKKRSPSLIPPFLKMGQYSETILELKRAKNNGHSDVLFLDTQNNVKESSASNIFFKQGKKYFTPRVDSGLLEGITRKYFIKYLRESGCDVYEEDIDIKELSCFENILLTNSLSLLQDVTTVGKDIWSSEKKFKKEINQLYYQFKNYCIKNYEGID